MTPLPTSTSATRKRLGLIGRFIVGYSGNLGRAHEFDTIIGAARLLRDDARFAFLITGGGAKAEMLRSAVQAEGLDSFVFQSYQPAERLSDSLAACDVHLVSLLPALEGLIVPSKVYGILAAGRPAVFIGDPSGDLARMLTTADCGVAIAVGESQRLASELVSLMDSPVRLQSMGERARELALAHYTSEHALSQWLDFLATITPMYRTVSEIKYT